MKISSRPRAGTVTCAVQSLYQSFAARKVCTPGNTPSSESGVSPRSIPSMNTFALTGVLSIRMPLPAVSTILVSAPAPNGRIAVSTVQRKAERLLTLFKRSNRFLYDAEGLFNGAVP